MVISKTKLIRPYIVLVILNFYNLCGPLKNLDNYESSSVRKCNQYSL